MYHGFEAAVEERNKQVREQQEQISSMSVHLEQQQEKISILRELSADWDRGGTIGLEHKVLMSLL